MIFINKTAPCPKELPNVQVSDTTEDDSSNADGQQKNNMNYKVIHTTTYTYDKAMSLCHNIARLMPRNTDSQICKDSVVKVNPHPDTISEYEDFFGNKVVYFAIQQEHKTLTVTVTSEITKIPANAGGINLYINTPWQHVIEQLYKSKEAYIDVIQYIPETHITTASREIEAYALQSYTPGRSMFEATKDLMHRIYADFKFESGFTTIATPLSEVMKQRKGVCQDFAHLAIACVRSVGLPARYVSGYLETIPPKGAEKLVGVDASHAWFAVYIPNAGWIDFDPTNNQLPSAQHITIGWGRDYADISPLKGIILSSGRHQLAVSVDVRRTL